MAIVTGEVPEVKTLRAQVPASAAGVDAEIAVGTAPFAGTVTRVSYVPNATLTGVVTNSRTDSVVNHAQDGTGATSVASKAFVNGVNAPAFDETAITLSVTPANLDVAKGDVLSFKSLHIGTGLADPGGEVEIDITRT